MKLTSLFISSLFFFYLLVGVESWATMLFHAIWEVNFWIFQFRLSPHHSSYIRFFIQQKSWWYKKYPPVEPCKKKKKPCKMGIFFFVQVGYTVIMIRILSQANNLRTIVMPIHWGFGSGASVSPFLPRWPWINPSPCWFGVEACTVCVCGGGSLEE